MVSGCLLASLLAGCRTAAEPVRNPDSVRTHAVTRGQLETLLRQLTIAFSSGDPERVDALVDPSTPVKEELVTALANAETLDLVRVSFAILTRNTAPTSSAGTPQGWQGPVLVTWRVDGYDAGLARAEVILKVRVVDGRAVVVGLGESGRRPLWLGAALAVRRTPHALVLASATNPHLGRLSALAEEAARVVRRAVPWWRGRLVIEAPEDRAAFARVLDAGPGEFASLAAVTSTVDGRLSATSPAHVVLNPDVFKMLSPKGALVVLTHEATHVATAASISTKVPLWLAEGFADHVALEPLTLSPQAKSAHVVALVRQGRLPRHLPGAGDFASHGKELQAAYEAARLACDALAHYGSEAALLRLYVDVTDGQPLHSALEKEFGLTKRRFVELWMDRLAHLAR